jgi:hypothetical protein
MSNVTTNISLPLKGMNTDVHPMNLGEQGYDFAQNAVIEEFTGNGIPLLQNEPSTLPCANFPTEYKVIGVANVVEQDRKILFLVNPATGFGQIGEILGRQEGCDERLQDNDETSTCADCDTVYVPASNSLENITLPPCCQYLVIADQECFNFNINNPVRVVYRLDDCGLSVFFTDNLNPYRYLEFDYQNDDASMPLVVNDRFKVIEGFNDPDCEYPIYADEIDCNKILIDPVTDPLCIEFIDVLQGGELRAGVYQFVAAYADENGNKRSPYFPASNPIPIFTRQITFETNYRTERSIQIRVANLSQEAPFEYYNIAVIKTIDNVSSFEFVGTFPITQNTVIYSGTEKSLRDLTQDDIFGRKVYYGKAKYVAKANNLLFWAGLEETEKINVQRIANNVKLFWQTVAIPEPAYREPRFNNLYRSYLRDEVYPMGISFVFDNQEETAVGHVPGPSREYFAEEYDIDVDEVIENDDVIADLSCANRERNKLWEVYNTAQLIFTNPTPNTSGDCVTQRCYQYGDFAYWESTDRYPNDPEVWGELCGQPIRYHKFPDCLVSHIHDREDETTAFTDNNVVFPLGIRVDHDSVVAAIAQAVTDGVISQATANRIRGYRIVRGNRFGNKSIIAKGLMYDVWNYIKDGTTFFYPNYPYNDLRPDQFLTEDPDTYDDHDDTEGDDLPFRPSGRYTFHSPDIHFVTPEIGEEIKIEAEEYGESEGYFNYCEEQAKFKLLSTTSYLIALAVGIVAMLTLTEPEECLEYTIKSNVIVEEAEFNTGQDITGTGLGQGAGTITTTNSGGFIGEHQQDHTTGPNDDFWTAGTGVNVGTTVGLGEEWTEKVVRTCTGQAHQYFNNPTLSALYGAFIFAQNLFYKIGLALQETEKIVDLIRTMTPKLNYAIQYNSVGKYNAFTDVDNTGFKRRKIETYSYLKPEKALINEATTSLATGASTIHFNNWHRETSLYFKIDQIKPYFPDPSVEDESRFKIGCRNDSDCDFSNYDGLRFYRPISAYYVALKRYLPNQYGQVTNVEYIDTGNCIFFNDEDYLDCELNIFGGDTFIPRFALKRKHSFFLQTRFKAQDETDVKYSELHNVAYPRHYIDNVVGVAQELEAGEGLLDIIADPGTALGRPKTYLDSKTDKFFYQNGRMYLYSYGIPYFLVESDINVDYRYGENVKEKDFYPHTTDLDFWLQEKNVDPREDNYYFYNNTYSKQNKEHIYIQYPIDFEPSRMCRVAHPNRIIQSDGANWLTYKANDFGDFPITNGYITGVDGVENERVLIRYENTFNVLNAYNTLQTSADTIQVGTGGVFASRAQEFAKTTLGHGGSQHNAILHTEFGHVWVDAKRGTVINLTGNADEISMIGMRNWFKENLPFQISKDFPEITKEDLDNNFKGIGLALTFDKRFNRAIITKLDYKVLNEDILYDADSKQFMLNDEIVELTDTRYFCNKSWTISYNFLTKAWTSFHSYTPNYYIDGVDYFSSGLNSNGSLWLHNLTNKSYQIVYGAMTPFTVQTIGKADVSKNNLNSVEFGLDAIRYHNYYDPFYTNNITFNKAWVFTQNQNSGLLELDFNDKRDLAELISYPITNVNSTTIRITNADGIWRFNQFYDLVQSRSSNIPIWLNNCSNTDKQINPQAIDYQMPDLDKRRMRGEWTKVRLTNDKESRYKMIFKWLVNKSVRNFR